MVCKNQSTKGRTCKRFAYSIVKTTRFYDTFVRHIGLELPVEMASYIYPANQHLKNTTTATTTTTTRTRTTKPTYHVKNKTKKTSAMFDNLILTSVINIIFTCSRCVALFTWFRGIACAKDHGLFNLYYPQSQRGQKSDPTWISSCYIFWMCRYWFCSIP